MCHGHWMRVPEPLQKMITRLYNNDMPLSGYQDACLNAVQQVQEKIHSVRLVSNAGMMDTALSIASTKDVKSN